MESPFQAFFFSSVSEFFLSDFLLGFVFIYAPSPEGSSSRGFFLGFLLGYSTFTRGNMLSQF